MAENKITDMETERKLNDYNNFLNTFYDAFTADIYGQDIIKDVSAEDLQKYFANPDNNVEVLSNLSEYFYISTGEIHMMFEMVESLPTLNYKIKVFDRPDSHDKYTALINKTMHKVKHKRLTRDTLKQTSNDGTYVGLWLGGKNNVYPYVFDNPKYAFPAGRRNNDWIVWFDLAYLDEKFNDFGRMMFFDNLSPYITKEKYELYLKERTPETQYVELPQNRSFVINTHRLKRNQGLGTGWANPAMYDILHKRKLKNVEQAIANKIINAIAVLTIGSDKQEATSNLNLSKPVKTKIHAGVKKALTEVHKSGVPVVSIPEFAKLEFPDIKADGLDGKKFNHVDGDIDSSLGLSDAVTNGTGGNNSSGKINIDFFYKRIGVLLEDIETEMYQKLINIILPKGQVDNYYLEYDKSQPLTLKEKIDILYKLNDKGFSVKAIIDNISDVDWQDYLDQTMYETEDLKLQSRIKPYMTSYTTSGDGEGGAPEKQDGELSSEGEATRTGDKNNI